MQFSPIPSGSSSRLGEKAVPVTGLPNTPPRSSVASKQSFYYTDIFRESGIWAKRVRPLSGAAAGQRGAWSDWLSLTGRAASSLTHLEAGAGTPPPHGLVGSFPMATMTNDHELDGLQQHTRVTLPSCGTELQQRSGRADTEVSTRLHFFPEAPGKNLCPCFSTSRASRFPWLRTSSSVFKANKVGTSLPQAVVSLVLPLLPPSSTLVMRVMTLSSPERVRITSLFF